MNRIIKHRKAIQRIALLCGVTMAGLMACQKTDSISSTDALSGNALKAASQTYTSEAFDEVMEIGDETLSLFERLVHGKDALNPDSTGLRGHHGHHGQGGPHGRNILDSLWRHGDSLCVGDLDHLRDSLEPAKEHFRLGKRTKISRDYAGDTLITTINFGKDSCTGFDGKVRQGKIIMTSIGDYWGGDAEITLRLVDYYVDGNQVQGTSTVTSTFNAAGNRESLIVEEGSVILADGSGTITWSSLKTREVTSGSDTYVKKDDIIEVTGSSSGTLVSGNTFTSQTQSPLVRNHQKGCSGVFISGITRITISDGTEIIVDYGDGTCDKLATVSTGGISETITLESFLPGHGRGHGRRH